MIGTTNYRSTEMPDFKGRKAFVLGGAFAGAIRQLMVEANFEPASTVHEADVVVFSGGEDVDPALYDEKPHNTVYFNRSRDDYEARVFEECKAKKKFMFGICRGAQFLHVMNGGKLWQNVQGHGGRSHMIVDLETDERVEATSLHHQMLKDNASLVVVAVCEEQISKSFESQEMNIYLREGGNEMEIEAGYYPYGGPCFFVQGHPEVGSPEYRSWTMNKLHECLIEFEGAIAGIPENKVTN